MFAETENDKLNIIVDPTMTWATFVENILEAITMIKEFDIITPADLYKVFTVCHLFSWAVILYKMRNL